VIDTLLSSGRLITEVSPEKKNHFSFSVFAADFCVELKKVLIVSALSRFQNIIWIILSNYFFKTCAV
jgi:hypothetical protein